MPYRGGRRTRTRRSYRTRRPTRSTRRVRRTRKTRVPRARFQPAIRQQGMYKLTYMEQDYYIDLTSNSSGTYAWRMNSLFDPNVTGSGNQPYGYDQLCAAAGLFNQYLVYASKITCYCRTDTGQVKRLHLCLYPTQDGATPGSYQEAIMKPGCKSLCYDETTEGTRGGTISCYSSIRKMWPQAGGLYETDFSANYNANPARTCYWLLAAFRDTA